VCPATYEAVMEHEEEGATGCLICGRSAAPHPSEVDVPVGHDPWEGDDDV